MATLEKIRSAMKAVRNFGPTNRVATRKKIRSATKVTGGGLGLANGVLDGKVARPVTSVIILVATVLAVALWVQSFFWIWSATVGIPWISVRLLVPLTAWVIAGGLIVRAFEVLHFVKTGVNPLSSRMATFFFGGYVKTVRGLVPYLLGIGANGVCIKHWGTVMISIKPQEYGFVSKNDVELESDLLEVPIHPTDAAIIAVRALSAEGTKHWRWLENVDFKSYVEDFVRPVLVQIAGNAFREHDDHMISKKDTFEKFRQKVLERVRDFPTSDASIFRAFPGLEHYSTLELWLESFGVAIDSGPVGFVDVNRHSLRHVSRQKVAQARDEAKVITIKAQADAEAITVKAQADAEAIGKKGDAKAAVDRRYLTRMGIDLDADEDISPELMRIAAAATDEGGVKVSDKTERKELRLNISDPKTAEILLALGQALLGPKSGKE